jgi:hypothetical protein
LKTVRDKLGICSTLLRSWPVPKATKLALEEWRPKKADAHQEGAARNALDAGQVGDYLSFIFNDSAHFSDRGRLFQSDRGRRFGAIEDAPGVRASDGLNVSQSSTISLKRPSRSGR